MAETAPASSGPPAVKRLSLRLDNGALIRRGAKDQPEVLPAAAAWKAGLLKEEQLLRIKALVCELHSKVPEKEPIKSINSTGSKQSAETVVEVGDPGTALGTSLKRPRSEDGFANGTGAVAPAAPAVPAVTAAAVPVEAAPAPADPYANFIPYCRNIINFIMSDQILTNAVNRNTFMHPVPPSIPGYYSVIKNPICFSDILRKLDQAVYTSPLEFYNDMLLLTDNCYTYNSHPAHQSIHYVNLGLAMERAIVLAWAKTPWSHLGQPPPERAPVVPIAPVGMPPKKPRTGYAAGAGARPRSHPVGAPQRGRGRGRGRPPGAVARTTSVNSYLSVQPLTQERTTALAAALGQNEVMEAKMEGVIGILQAANELPTNEEGEVELDLSMLSASVVWQLYEYVIGPPGVAAAAGVGAAPPAPGGMMQEDSDYNPDEDDED